MNVQHNVELPDGPTAQLFASRTSFSWKGFVLLSQYVAVCDFGDQDVIDRDAVLLYEAAFRKAKKVNRIPLPRGLQFGFMIIPCLIVDKANESLLQFARHAPRKHWSVFEFPIVVERRTGKVSYFKDTPLWGAFFFSDLRKLAEQCIEIPVLTANIGTHPR